MVISCPIYQVLTTLHYIQPQCPSICPFTPTCPIIYPLQTQTQRPKLQVQQPRLLTLSTSSGIHLLMLRHTLMPLLSRGRTTRQVIPPTGLVIIQIPNDMADRHAVEIAARGSQFVLIEAIRLTPLCVFHYGLRHISIFPFWGRIATHIAKLVASLLCDGHTRPLLDKLSDKVRPRRLALDPAV